jgi:hypothetical protein
MGGSISWMFQVGGGGVRAKGGSGVPPVPAGGEEGEEASLETRGYDQNEREEGESSGGNEDAQGKTRRRVDGRGDRACV